jgi:tetratricopeptide (TPR) repeat protein
MMRLLICILSLVITPLLWAEKTLTLDDLPAIRVRLNPTPLPTVTREEVIDKYRDYLLIAKEPELRTRVLRRIAGLQLMEGEDRLADIDNLEDSDQGEFYQLAIEAYEDLLAELPDRADNDHILYQLAKAYVLSGDQLQALVKLDQLVEKHPNSEYYEEVQFRRGELYFANGFYDDSENAYTAIVSMGKEGRYYANALYMQGWSYFKMGKYDPALESYSYLLDTEFPDIQSIVKASKSNKDLLDDALRIMSLIFTYQKGHQSLAALYERLGHRHYEYLLYQHLAKHYADKRLYQASAATYLGFINLYPDDVLAPGYYTKVIEVFTKARYGKSLIKHKGLFAQRFGINSSYWSNASEPIKDVIRPSLKAYTAELAQHHHAGAQKIKNSWLKRKARFLEASSWYQDYIAAFPNDEQVPKMHFLLAESQYEAGNFENAIKHYEIAAYQSPGFKKGSEAGFAALLTYNRLMRGKDKPQRLALLEKKANSAIDFADTYPKNKRVALVLARAAEHLFEINKLQQAVDVTTRITELLPVAEEKHMRTAWLVMGHASFDLASYQLSEKAYTNALALNIVPKKKFNEIRERLAASIYKQGEQLLAQGDKAAAVEQLLRVEQVVPETPLRISALYDAGTYVMQMEDWQRSIELLKRFRSEYPKHKFTADIPSRLVVAYEGAQEWKNAAYELQQIASISKDKEVQRKALFQSAQYYEKSGDLKNTLNMYRRYAHAYPKPFDIGLEARLKMVDLYGKLDDRDKQRFWQKKIISLHDNAGKDQTDRSRYLASNMSFELADEARENFETIVLSWPIQKSMELKKNAFDAALKGYNKVVNYKVSDFTTASTFRIAQLYGRLSRDIMASERPPGLDELELEEFDLLIEDQAIPFEDAAIEVFETNATRTFDGIYDNWVEKTIDELAVLIPAKYNKKEQVEAYVEQIR